MRIIILVLSIIILSSCKAVPKDGAYADIIANDPVVGRASITCLQTPAHHQPIPITFDKKNQRTKEVTDANDCMESEMKKVTLERAKKPKDIKLEIDIDKKRKDEKESIVISKDSEEFDLERLEKIIKKKDQVKE